MTKEILSQEKESLLNVSSESASLKYLNEIQQIKKETNCVIETSSRSTSPTSSSTSPAPAPPAENNTTNPSLKRKNSTDDFKSECVERDDSPRPPPTKNTKFTYSIMNILGVNENKSNEKESKGSPNGKAICSRSSSPLNSPNSSSATSNSPSAPANPNLYVQNMPNQPNFSSSANSQHSMNPFLLNPFLAAAAAASGGNHLASLSSLPSSLLNNISNMAFMSNSKNQSELWPWFNMAAMSAMYNNFDKGYSSAFLPGNDSSAINHHQQQQVQINKGKSSHLIQNQASSNTKEAHELSNQENQTIPDHFNQFMNNIWPKSTLQENVSSSSSSSNRNNLSSPLSSTNRDSSSKSANSSFSTRFNMQLKDNNNSTNSEFASKSLNESVNNRKPMPSSLLLTQHHHSHQHNIFETEKRNLIENRKLMNMNRSFGDDDDQDESNLNDEIVEELEEDDDDLDDQNGSFDSNHRKKKTRTVFSRNQVFQLESTFDMKRYLSSSERTSLANSLHLTETQIKIWFQNRRNKWKRQLAAEIEANTALQQHPNSNQQSTSNNQVHSQLVQQSSQSNLLNQMQQRSQQQHQLQNQRVLRMPSLYNDHSSNKTDRVDFDSFATMNQQNISSSSSASSTSSLASPQSNNQAAAAAAAAAAVFNHLNANSSNVNPSSILSPSMLAAAAAASQLYYAAAAAGPNGFTSQFSSSNGHQSLKQPLSGIL